VSIFLNDVKEKLPVIVKFSNDTEVGQVPELMDTLFSFGFDGVNFGNSSTQYDRMRDFIHKRERRLFDYFVREFEGGVSGRPLRELSIRLASEAARYLRAGCPSQEFHVIRTGGINCANDLIESREAGIALNQWFTGYFDNFARQGHELYRRLYEEFIGKV